MSGFDNLILKEGWPSITVAALAALLLSIAGCEWSALAALLATLALIWIYRRPARSAIHFEKGSVTAPCDGKVTAVRTFDDGTMNIEIESGCFDASVLTAPFESVSVSSSVMRGARLPRKSPLFEKLNEYGTLMFTGSDGHVVSIMHRLSRASAALVIDSTGKRGLSCAGQYGVMTRGMIYISLPASTRIAVNPGERVVGAETLLGYIG